MAISEVLTCVIGWCFMGYFIFKYAKLNKINANHSEQDTHSAQLASINEEVRASVVDQITGAVEVADPRKLRDAVTSLFNKQQALRESRDFASLRESMALGMSLAQSGAK